MIASVWYFHNVFESCILRYYYSLEVWSNRKGDGLHHSVVNNTSGSLEVVFWSSTARMIVPILTFSWLKYLVVRINHLVLVSKIASQILGNLPGMNVRHIYDICSICRPFGWGPRCRYFLQTCLSTALSRALWGPWRSTLTFGRGKWFYPSVRAVPL